MIFHPRHLPGLPDIDFRAHYHWQAIRNATQDPDWIQVEFVSESTRHV
jgi:hypothetical protein